MKLKFLPVLILTILASGSALAQTDYGIPEDIKDGNILHCFDWKLGDIRTELPNIAAAGFGAIQISPMQQNAATGKNWSDLYRPYDFAVATISNGLGTVANLKSLCQEAEKYGIKIIVDVVFNHTDNSGYRDRWWNENDRLRNTTSKINYGNRNSITHDLLGDYPEVNTENPEVIERAKAYIEELKSYGVKGIRFDAAKHIGLPSEGSDFWKEVTSVSDMFYYGEILSSPGGSNANALMEEYTQYMSVTDDEYGKTVRNNAGVASASGNWANKGIDASKLVYWGESHDTYANEPSYGGVTKNVSQAVIDRAYANVACRNKSMALYLSRPRFSSYGEIKVGQKGTTHFMDPEVAEVNKFKNAMVGKADYYVTSNGVASITRQNGGAVIINRTGAGTVSATNGGAYCPPGTYIDRVSGNEFTVTPTTIKGTVGASGIAVIYNDNTDSGISDIFDNESFDESKATWYNLHGMRINNPTDKGVYIVVSPSGKTKKVVIP